MEAIGPLQLRVMHFIWNNGPSTVHQVHEALNTEDQNTQLAYTTILTVMRNLSRRSVLDQRPNGRSHIFEALVSRDDYKQGMLAQVCEDLFEGKLESMVDYIQGNSQSIHQLSQEEAVN